MPEYSTPPLSAGLIATCREAGVCMLSTLSEDGELVSRPMKVNAVDDDGTFWFFASASSDKIGAFEHDQRANVAFVSGEQWVSVAGDIDLVDDTEAKERHWALKSRSFIADDPHDPELVLLRMRTHTARTWQPRDYTARV